MTFPDAPSEAVAQEAFEARMAGSPARSDIPFGTDPAAMDAEVMPLGEWLGCWRIDMQTGELVSAEA